DPRRVTRHFDPDPERDPLVGLDPQAQDIRLQWSAAVPVIEDPRHVLELDGDLRRPLRQPLAGAQVERDTGPAPIVDRHSQRGVRLGPGGGVHSRLLPVAGDLATEHPAGAVLPALGLTRYFFGPDG